MDTSERIANTELKDNNPSRGTHRPRRGGLRARGGQNRIRSSKCPQGGQTRVRRRDDGRSRRAYLGAVGVGTLCALAGCTEQIEQTLDEFDDAAVSEEVYRTRDSFEFEASTGDEIFINVRIVDEGDSRGRLWLVDPNGTEVIDERIRLTTTIRETYTADVDGTYLVGIDPGDARLQLTISVTPESETAAVVHAQHS